MVDAPFLGGDGDLFGAFGLGLRRRLVGGSPGARRVTQEEALSTAARTPFADLEEARPLDGGHDLLGAHLALVQRQERELRLHVLALEHLEVGQRHLAGVLDAGVQLVFGHPGDVLEAAQDRRTAAQRPQLPSHLVREVPLERLAELRRKCLLGHHVTLS